MIHQLLKAPYLNKSINTLDGSGGFSIVSKNFCESLSDSNNISLLYGTLSESLTGSDNKVDRDFIQARAKRFHCKKCCGDLLLILFTCRDK